MMLVSRYLSVNLFYRILLVISVHLILLFTLNLSTIPSHLASEGFLPGRLELLYGFSSSIVSFSSLISIDIMLGVSIYGLELSYSNMLIPMICSGCTRLRLAKFFLPVAIFFGIFNFCLQEFGVRFAREVLHDLGSKDLDFLSATSEGDLWLRNRTDILYIKRGVSSTPDSQELGSALLFERDSAGILLFVHAAETLRKSGDKLIFAEVTSYNVKDLSHKYSKDGIIYNFNFESINYANLLPEDLPFDRLVYLASLPDLGILPKYVYESYLYRRIASIFSPISIMILCLYMIPILRRNASYSIFLFSLCGIGFCSFILERMTILLAENGTIPPYYTGFSVVLLQILFAIMFALRYEKLR